MQPTLTKIGNAVLAALCTSLAVVDHHGRARIGAECDEVGAALDDIRLRPRTSSPDAPVITVK
jgi:hypothetical protein